MGHLGVVLSVEIDFVTGSEWPNSMGESSMSHVLGRAMTVDFRYPGAVSVGSDG